MRELKYPSPPIGRLYLQGTNYVTRWWHVDFVNRILDVTVDVPANGLTIGPESSALSLHIPGHTVGGKQMTLTATQYLSPDRANLRFTGHQLFLN